jgi:hypothetical protein
MPTLRIFAVACPEGQFGIAITRSAEKAALLIASAVAKMGEKSPEHATHFVMLAPKHARKDRRNARHILQANMHKAFTSVKSS